MPNCSGGFILHIDGTIAGCTLDDDIDGREGLEERHEDAPEICWKFGDAAIGLGYRIRDSTSASNYGIVPEAALPFEPPVLYPDQVPTFHSLAARLRIATYHNLGFDLTDWRTWLADQGPIAARIDCDKGWMDAKKRKGKLSRYSPSTVDGGHAVAIVGYTPTSFIIRNSWGTKDWGDRGYAYASNSYATAAFTEAYGVTL